MMIFATNTNNKELVFFLTGLFSGCLTYSMAFWLSVRATCFTKAGGRCVMVASVHDCVFSVALTYTEWE